MHQCFVCDTITPCYAFASRLICGDCASDGGLLYAELHDGEFLFEFARRERVRRVISFVAADLPLDVIGPVVRFYKLRLDRDLERITRGEAPLTPAGPRRRASDVPVSLPPTRPASEGNDHLENAA